MCRFKSVPYCWTLELTPLPNSIWCCLYMQVRYSHRETSLLKHAWSKFTSRGKSRPVSSTCEGIFTLALAIAVVAGTHKSWGEILFLPHKPVARIEISWSRSMWVHSPGYKSHKRCKSACENHKRGRGNAVFNEWACSFTTHKSAVLILSMQRLETTRNVSKAPIFKSLSHIAPSSSQLCKKSCASMSQVVAVKIVLQTNQSIDNAPVALRMIFGVVNQLQFFNDSDVRCSKKLSPPMAMSCSFWTFPDIFTQLFANSRITVAILKLSQFCHFCSLSKCVWPCRGIIVYSSLKKQLLVWQIRPGAWYLFQ